MSGSKAPRGPEPPAVVVRRAYFQNDRADVLKLAGWIEWAATVLWSDPTIRRRHRTHGDLEAELRARVKSATTAADRGAAGRRVHSPPRSAEGRQRPSDGASPRQTASAS